MKAFALIALILSSVLFAVAPVSARLTVEFERTGMTVTGVSPGGAVALLGVAKEPDYFRATVTYHREHLIDADLDGSITYPLERDVPATSVWAFVDVASGQATVATPEDGVMRQVDFPLEGSLTDRDGGFVLVDDRRSELELLYVRPRVTAWHCAVADGGSTDRDDSTNGRVRVHLSDLQELGGGGRRVTEALPGDMLVAIDRYQGEYFVLEIDETTRR